jgi:hypothetical protein
MTFLITAPPVRRLITLYDSPPYVDATLLTRSRFCALVPTGDIRIAMGPLAKVTPELSIRATEPGTPR